LDGSAVPRRRRGAHRIPLLRGLRVLLEGGPGKVPGQATEVSGARQSPRVATRGLTAQRAQTLMIERIIEFSIRRRWLVVLAAAVLALWGVRAAYRTPVDAIPDLSENQVVVFTDWPGHGPREVEDQVTYPVALRLQGLGGVRVVRSSSDVGF